MKNKKIIVGIVLIVLAILTGWSILDRSSNDLPVPTEMLQIKETALLNNLPEPDSQISLSTINRAENNNLRPEDRAASTTNNTNPPPLKDTAISPKNSVQATVLAGNTTISLAIPENTTFYNALIQAKSEGKIDFEGKNYPGIGFFVTDIGTLHSGDGLDLLYYVNGKEATVGVSSYILKNGDVIEWKLE